MFWLTLESGYLLGTELTESGRVQFILKNGDAVIHLSHAQGHDWRNMCKVVGGTRSEPFRYEDEADE